jgi:hypothetical protein
MPLDDGERLFAEMLIIPADFATQAHLISPIRWNLGAGGFNFPARAKHRGYD